MHVQYNKESTFVKCRVQCYLFNSILEGRYDARTCMHVMNFVAPTESYVTTVPTVVHIHKSAVIDHMSV